MAKSIQQLTQLATLQVYNMLKPGGVDNKIVGELFLEILGLAESLVGQTGEVFHGYITPGSSGPSIDLTGNLSYISSQTVAGTYTYKNFGNLSVTISAGEAPASLFITRVKNVWSARVIPLAINLDHLALADDLVTTTAAVQDLVVELMAEIEKREQLGTDTSTRLTALDKAISDNLKNIQLLRITDMSQLDNLTISDLSQSNRVRVYLLSFLPGSGSTLKNNETSILIVTQTNSYIAQTYIGQRMIDANGVFLDTGYIDRVAIYSRGKVASNPFSKWVSMVDSLALEERLKYTDTVLGFAEVVSVATVKLMSTTSAGDVVFVKSAGCFALRVVEGSTTNYYNNWNGRGSYQSEAGIPISRKYIDAGKTVYWYLAGDMKKLAIPL